MVRDTSGRPLPGAVVRVMTARSVPLPLARSGPDGGFRLAGLPADRYLLMAGKTGFRTRRVAASPSIDGTRVDLGPDDTKSVLLELEPLGAIEGQVGDERGEPVVGALVHAMRLRYDSGQRHLVPAGSPSHTDDRGHLPSPLAPRWALRHPRSMADPQASETSGYGDVYFPFGDDPA
ncbi:MAG: carboxypeptidase-like regulatory domain-containing protein [Vicinamibacterales bacterium]